MLGKDRRGRALGTTEGRYNLRGVWTGVVLIVVASVLLGLALVLSSWPVAVAGAVVGVAGLGLSVWAGIMNVTH